MPLGPIFDRAHRIGSSIDSSPHVRRMPIYNCSTPITITSRVHVEGKSSVCLICIKYKIIFLIIIIISLGQILLLYIANTSRMHTRTHTCTHLHTHACACTRANACTHTPPPHTHTHTHTPSLFDGSLPANRDGPLRW